MGHEAEGSTRRDSRLGAPTLLLVLLRDGPFFEPGREIVFAELTACELKDRVAQIVRLGHKKQPKQRQHSGGAERCSPLVAVHERVAPNYRVRQGSSLLEWAQKEDVAAATRLERARNRTLEVASVSYASGGAVELCRDLLELNKVVQQAVTELCDVYVGDRRKTLCERKVSEGAPVPCDEPGHEGVIRLAAVALPPRDLNRFGRAIH